MTRRARRDTPTGEHLARLHRAWLRQLRFEWEGVNRDHLGRRLRPPILRIEDAGTRRGSWQADHRTLAISEAHILDDPWHEVGETLKHEMAHQVVDELYGGEDERPHGPLFARAAEALCLHTPTAEGAEAGRVLERVRKLLALAGSANVHEAEAAMAKANTLLLRYNLELAGEGAGDGPGGVGYRFVGASAAAVALHKKMVAVILEEFFFVECIWTTTYDPRRDRAERILEVCGTPANLDFAEHVHDFLHAELQRLWQRQRREGSVSGRRAKRQFLYGVLSGFGDKLRAERAQNAERGLVWVGDPRLRRFYRRRHPHVGSMRSGRVALSDAYRSGREEGGQLTVHRPIRSRGGGGGGLLR